MGIRWANSADKHGIDHADALHAIGNAHYVEEEFDEPRVPGHAKPTLFIGPPRQLGGPLLEVMVEMQQELYRSPMVLILLMVMREMMC